MANKTTSGKAKRATERRAAGAVSATYQRDIERTLLRENLKPAMTGRLHNPLVTILFAATTVAMLLVGCSGMPTLEEQKERILSRNFQIDMLTPEAFVEAWGEAPYQYQATRQFFPLKNGQYKPDFRVPLGEAPTGWDSTVVFGPSLFFAYPDQGELVGFMEGRMVYREIVPAEELHALGKAWANERRFKTTIETGSVKPR